MDKRISLALAAGLFLAGIGVGYAGRGIDPALYRDKPEPDAAQALLELAMEQADGGSWEEIAVGRVHYLGGDRARGQAIFDRWLNGRHEDSDVYRIARVYREAGEWDKARALFDRYVADNPRDESGLAEVGAYYLIAGDRATAERLFEQSFRDPHFWSTVAVAGSYLDVPPQQ